MNSLHEIEMPEAGVQWLGRAAFDPGDLERLWARDAEASALLPAGRTFDVLDLDDAQGSELFVKLANDDRYGPVFRTAHQWSWLVRPSHPRRFGQALSAAGWPARAASPVLRGYGRFVSLPGRRSRPDGRPWWIRPPDGISLLPDLDDLLSTAVMCLPYGES